MALQQSINMLLANPLILYTGILIGVVYIIYTAYQEFYSKEEIEKTELHDRVDNKIKPIIDFWGKRSKKRLRQGFQVVGVVKKSLVATTNLESLDLEEEQSVSYEDKIDNSNIETMYLLETRPDFKYTPFEFVAWFILDALLGLDKFENRVVVSKKYVDVNEEVSIDDKVEFTDRAGLHIQKDKFGNAFILETVFEDILDESLETFGDIAEKINELNIKYIMNVAQMEEELRLQDEYDRSNDRTLNRMNRG